MLGNVTEYVCSAYSENYENNNELTCDFTANEQRMVRGGNFTSPLFFVFPHYRPATVSDSEGSETIGFRVVLEDL